MPGLQYVLVFLLIVELWLTAALPAPESYEVAADEEFKVGSKTNFVEKGDDESPEEAGFVEGDLIMPPESQLTFRSALLNPDTIWEHGIVPYVYSDSFTKREKKIIKQAMANFKALTCVRFIPRTTETDFLAIKRPEHGCSSQVGHKGRMQEMNLGKKCFRLGIVMHELMHVLGFLHEQNRYDRDKYVRIVYENMKPGHEGNFKKYTASEATNQNMPYDYGSIMHYRLDTFSSNKNPTMVALQPIPPGLQIGQRLNFSDLDIKKINQRYSCSTTK